MTGMQIFVCTCLWKHSSCTRTPMCQFHNHHTCESRRVQCGRVCSWRCGPSASYQKARLPAAYSRAADTNQINAHEMGVNAHSARRRRQLRTVRILQQSIITLIKAHACACTGLNALPRHTAPARRRLSYIIVSRGRLTHRQLNHGHLTA